MNLRFVFLFALCYCFFSVKSQIFSNKEQTEFATYLLSTGQNKLLFQLGKQISLTKTNASLLDSFNYYSGWAAYNLKMLDTSAFLLQKVPLNNPFYHKSHFFAMYELSHLRRYDEARKCLNNIEAVDSFSLSLKQFSQAGLALLNEDVEQYNIVRKTLNPERYFYEQELSEFDNLANRLKLHSTKSEAVAGILSAFMPGLGKMYTEQYGEGFAAFFANAILAAIVIENYKKAGLTNYKTILYGSCFATFYVGNILGSMASVKVYRSDFKQSHENAVLFNLHISLRKYFD